MIVIVITVIITVISDPLALEIRKEVGFFLNIDIAISIHIQFVHIDKRRIYSLLILVVVLLVIAIIIVIVTLKKKMK